NSHVPISLCRYWNESGRMAKLTVPSVDDTIVYPWIKPAIKGLKKNLVYKLGSRERPRVLTEQLFLKTEKRSSPVYLWAGLSLDIFSRFHDMGAKIIIERINCHRATSRRIISEAGKFRGISLPNSITDEQIAEENRKLSFSEAVFCPSPMVKSSMLENGVSEASLLSTSYGWAPERFPLISEPRIKNRKPVFLFAGTLCVRKGIPLLLEAWKKADVDGKLLLCGGIDDDIQAVVARHLTASSIRHIGYTRNIGEVYRIADVFVFPSLEEGGPMVTYEAMAHGIPPLVTAMGGGAIVQNGINGLVLSDLDVDAWAQAIAELVDNSQKRAELGENARVRAEQFTWRNVAEQRAMLLESRFPELWNKNG
ncbi:MAG: glycosyltransferase family 4 protein, partial [Chlorobiaceae bacterium]|nr:glycosyltransferase family 4 protein [Chlorobiaceae bacterium]